MCIDVRGILLWPESEFKNALGWIFQDGGEPFASVRDLKMALMDELAEGHEKLPMAPCDNFDWKTGCRGHPVTEEEEVTAPPEDTRVDEIGQMTGLPSADR